jgi:hypothetical protein
MQDADRLDNIEAPVHGAEPEKLGLGVLDIGGPELLRPAFGKVQGA